MKFLEQYHVLLYSLIFKNGEENFRWIKNYLRAPHWLSKVHRFSGGEVLFGNLFSLHLLVLEQLSFYIYITVRGREWSSYW